VSLRGINILGLVLEIADEVGYWINPLSLIFEAKLLEIA
jgi:hypothetical protein